MATGDIEAIIVSDANEHFINHFLERNNLSGLISRVISNKSEVSAGSLHVTAYHNHECRRNESPCAENMCKGQIILDFLSEKDRDGYANVWYLGDGSGDFCPSKILLEEVRNGGRDKDSVRIFCREEWSLHQRLTNEYCHGIANESSRTQIESCIVSWSDYDALTKAIDELKPLSCKRQKTALR